MTMKQLSWQSKDIYIQLMHSLVPIHFLFFKIYFNIISYSSFLYYRQGICATHSFYIVKNCLHLCVYNRKGQQLKNWVSGKLPSTQDTPITLCLGQIHLSLLGLNLHWLKIHLKRSKIIFSLRRFLKYRYTFLLVVIWWNIQVNTDITQTQFGQITGELTSKLPITTSREKAKKSNKQ